MMEEKGPRSTSEVHIRSCILTFTDHIPVNTSEAARLSATCRKRHQALTPYTMWLCLQPGLYRGSSLWPVSGAFPCLLQVHQETGYPFTLSCQRLEPPYMVFYLALYYILHSPFLTTLATPLLTLSCLPL